jgi:hypothetical protein
MSMNLGPPLRWSTHESPTYPDKYVQKYDFPITQGSNSAWKSVWDLSTYIIYENKV